MHMDYCSEVTAAEQVKLSVCSIFESEKQKQRSFLNNEA